MREIRTCENCVNRLLCPTRKTSKPNDICDGYNEEGVFRGLLTLAFPFVEKIIDDRLNFIKKLQDSE